MSLFPKQYDVIVVGGGHAGTEAALAAARMGSQTLLITHNIETVGQMSCNPAIGGIGKSHLVKEIDALDGVMAKATDFAGIQFRILNSRKGPAVRATRAQADRQLYRQAIRGFVESQENLTLFQQPVDDIVVENGVVTGVKTAMGLIFSAKTVVLSTGTFLGGIIHVGLDHHAGGRAGDMPANALSERLRALPFRVGRLKTGTPPRIDAKTVDFSVMQEQPGDLPLPVMSYMGSVSKHPAQISCFITHTNEATHDIIRDNLDRSPMFSGKIEGVGPRYCPSIEDKIHRFADKSSHQIFVEPEGLNTNELYPNGISTSLPFDVQLNLIKTIKGFEHAHITRPGYAIEYDYFNPQDLNRSLETRFIENLYFAGQINGTTGYEEAAAQGLLAGMNASLKSQGKPAWIPSRESSYIGVMVDDLVSLGTQEPYRMFTSRAEHRLLLREDNADVRLTEIGYQLGVVGEERWSAFQSKNQAVESLKVAWPKTWVQANSDAALVLNEHLGAPLSKEHSLAELIRRPELNVDIFKAAGLVDSTTHPAVLEQAEVQFKYEGYIARQYDEIAKRQKQNDVKIPADFDYDLVAGLSSELNQKLKQAKPDNIGQASRIPGVTPAALSLIIVYIKKSRHEQASSSTSMSA